jgi:cyanate lyase
MDSGLLAALGPGMTDRLLARHLLYFRAGNATSNHRRSSMTRAELTEKLLDIKREKGWTWKYICDEIGGMSQAAKAAEMFGLGKSEQVLLNEVPNRGSPMPPTDPLIYRFYELVMVNGPALKVLIEEEFGDGIMSAIDFDLQMERQPDPKGDRVRISMSGKFLPYKYYGSTGNAQAYGYKEE